MQISDGVQYYSLGTKMKKKHNNNNNVIYFYNKKILKQNYHKQKLN